jgi:hypothetical protein
MYSDAGNAVVMTRAMLAELGLPLVEVPRYELPKLPNNLPQGLAPILLICAVFGLAINKCTDSSDDTVPNRLNNVNSSVVKMDMPEQKPSTADFGGDSIEKETDDAATLKYVLKDGYNASFDVKKVMYEIDKKKNLKYLILEVWFKPYHFHDRENREEVTANLEKYNKFIGDKSLGQFIIHVPDSGDEFYYDEAIKVVRDKKNIGSKFKLNIFNFGDMTLLDLKVDKNYMLTEEDIGKIRNVVNENFEFEGTQVYLVGEDPDGIFEVVGHCKRHQLKACIQRNNTDKSDYYNE